MLNTWLQQSKPRGPRGQSIQIQVATRVKALGVDCEILFLSMFCNVLPCTCR